MSSSLPSVAQLASSQVATPGELRVTNVRLRATGLVAPPTGKLPSISVMGDRLFSRTSLRNITAANIREREQLVHRYRSIETAAKTTQARLEHQKVSVRRKAEWLKSKLEDRPWMRLLEKPRRIQSEPPRGGSTHQYPDAFSAYPAINVETNPGDVDLDDGRTKDAWSPGDDGQRTTRRFANGLDTYWRSGSDNPVTMEDVRRLARRLYMPTPDDPEELAEERERRIVDFLIRMIMVIENNLLNISERQKPSNPGLGQFNPEAFSRLVTALEGGGSKMADRSSSSSSFADEKRRRYLEQMNVNIIRLPPIYSTEPLMPKPRDWDITERTPAPPKLTDRDWLELQLCRYLRHKPEVNTSPDENTKTCK